MLIVIIVNMCLYLSVQYMLSNHTDVSYMVSERGLFSPRSGTIRDTSVICSSGIIII